MNAARRKRIYLLLDIVLQLDPGERCAYLDTACAGDEPLRREIESLLAADEQASAHDYLGIPAVVKFANVTGAKAMTEQPMILNGRYKIEEELGRGGFGVAWLASDLNLHSRLVVVKMLKPGDGEGRDLFEYRLRKFRGEIDALTRFRHPHIVGILDQGALTDDEPFLVMEFIEGVPLSSVMNNQRMEFARVARIMRQAGEALDYAHRRGVFHRDLKPENMMVRTAEGEDFVSLIDFGLATVQEWPHKVRSSGSPNTYLVGTPEYMAPEQIRKDPSAASDIWAQGVIAYEMLTGQLPFDVPRDQQYRMRPQAFSEMLKAGVQVKPKELRPDLSEAAQSTILRALAYETKDRFSSARDFSEALATALFAQNEKPHSVFIHTPAKTQPATDTAPTLLNDLSLAEVVISYAAQDIWHAQAIASHLTAAGISYWMTDYDGETACTNFAETRKVIHQCQALLLVCSDATLHSTPVKQDLQAAWRYERSILPLLVEPLSFAQQADYLFEDKQWIEAPDTSSERWLSLVLRALAEAGVRMPRVNLASLAGVPVIQPTRLDHSLCSLRSIARLTNQIWPVPAEQLPRATARSGVRGMGALPEEVTHGFRLGSHIGLAIKSDRAGHLLLLDEGPEGIIYCLCPSWFAPDTRLREGRSYLPQAGSRYDAFVVSGKPGREHLLAIVTDAPLGLDWLPSDPKIPARVLKQVDVDALLARLRGLEGDRWTALSTYFDVID